MFWSFCYFHPATLADAHSYLADCDESSSSQISIITSTTNTTFAKRVEIKTSVDVTEDEGARSGSRKKQRGSTVRLQQRDENRTYPLRFLLILSSFPLCLSTPGTLGDLEDSSSPLQEELLLPITKQRKPNGSVLSDCPKEWHEAQLGFHMTCSFNF